MNAVAPLMNIINTVFRSANVDGAASIVLYLKILGCQNYQLFTSGAVRWSMGQVFFLSFLVTNDVGLRCVRHYVGVSVSR